MVHRIWTSYFFTYQAQTEKNMSQDSCWPPALYLGTTYLFWPKFINAGLIQKARVFESWVLAPIYCQQSSLFWLVTVHIPSLKHIITTFYPNNINIIILHFYPNDMTVISISIPMILPLYTFLPQLFHFYPNDTTIISFSIIISISVYPNDITTISTSIPVIFPLYPFLSRLYYHWISFGESSEQKKRQIWTQTKTTKAYQLRTFLSMWRHLDRMGTPKQIASVQLRHGCGWMNLTMVD